MDLRLVTGLLTALQRRRWGDLQFNIPREEELTLTWRAFQHLNLNSSDNNKASLRSALEIDREHALILRN